MPDPSADRPLLLPEEIFSEEDVQLVADALTASNVRRWEEQLPVPAWCDLATAALHALAAAGRLLPPSAEHRERDMDVLAMVGRMYLDALDSDPDNEMLTLPQAMLVTEVREAVERRERSWVEVDGSQPDA